MLPSVAQVLGFFNLLIGLTLVASVLLFFGGFIMYLIRLGTWPTYRDDALIIMEWGVATLFTLVVLVILQQYLARHLLFTVTLVALVIIAVVAWLIASDLAEPPPKKEG